MRDPTSNTPNTSEGTLVSPTITLHYPLAPSATPKHYMPHSLEPRSETHFNTFQGHPFQLTIQKFLDISFSILKYFI